MLKKVFTVHDVGHSFEIMGNSVIFITTNGSCRILNLLNELEPQEIDAQDIMGQHPGLKASSQNVFYLFSENHTKSVNLINKDINILPFKIEEINDFRIFGLKRVDGKRFLLSNSIQGENIWQIQTETGKFSLIVNNNLINTKFLDDSKINFYDKSTGEIQWSYNTTQLGTWTEYDGTSMQTEVRRILGVLDEKLYIYLNSGKVLVLDINTGEKIDLIINDKNNDQGSFWGMFMHAIELDIKNNRLIQLFNERYTEVNLDTLDVRQIHIDEMKELNISNMNEFVFDDEYIYFSDRYESKLATLNRKTMRIDWIHSLSDTVGCEMGGSRHGRHLKLHNGRLYVVDNKHTLHIFEREALL